MDELRVRVHADLQTSTMSVDEAAAVLGQSTDVLWRYVRAGDLAHIRVQGTDAIEYRILAQDVHDLQARLRSNADGKAVQRDSTGRSQAAVPRVDNVLNAPPQQPIGKRLAGPPPEERPSMAMMRPPTGPLKAQAGTITHAGGFGAAETVDVVSPPPEVTAHLARASVAPVPTAAESEHGVRAGASPPAEAQPEPAQEAHAASRAGTVDATASPAAADSRPPRPALPPISSVVTVSGTALHRIGHTGFSENDAMRLFQSMMESLVAPITAANERLADENTRLLELARMQSQALDKAGAEREALMDRLAVLPTEMQKLYERLGALQAEVHRLEQENSRPAVPQDVAWKQRTSWWRRLFGLD